MAKNKSYSEADSGPMGGYDPDMGEKPSQVSNSNYQAPATGAPSGMVKGMKPKFQKPIKTGDFNANMANSGSSAEFAS